MMRSPLIGVCRWTAGSGSAVSSARRCRLQVEDAQVSAASLVVGLVARGQVEDLGPELLAFFPFDLAGDDGDRLPGGGDGAVRVAQEVDGPGGVVRESEIGPHHGVTLAMRHVEQRNLPGLAGA